MSDVTNPLQACNSIFVKPKSAFQALNEKDNWSWVAFFLVIAMSILPVYLYMNFVDFDWYKELIIATEYADISPAEQDMMRGQMARTGIMTVMLIFAVLGPIVINAVLALYLNLTTKSDEENLNGFTDWYGFTWWVGMPIVVSGLIAIGLIAVTDDHQTLPTILGPLSLAYLLNVQMDSDWFGLAQAIRLDSFWSIYLIAVGIGKWTSFSTKKSAIIAIAPFFIIWMIMAIFSMI